MGAALRAKKKIHAASKILSDIIAMAVGQVAAVFKGDLDTFKKSLLIFDKFEKLKVTF